MEPRLAADSEPAESQQVAREELETLLDTALARGTWNELDRDRFRSQLAQANEADQETMLAALATAINHQKLRVSLRGAPW